jgi:hypothetical protein
MPLTDAGRNFIAEAIINDGPPTHFDNSNAAIGVGDSSTAFASGQTDLQAASNKARVGMDGSYPQIATNTLTFRSTFNPATANFAWEEWGVFNNTTGGTMLSRKVEALGTKSASQTWQVTVDLDVLVGA